eukprot:scaffold600228_cov41-Prasinocladus_malaysianus.AAC.1
MNDTSYSRLEKGLYREAAAGFMELFVAKCSFRLYRLIYVLYPTVTHGRCQFLSAHSKWPTSPPGVRNDEVVAAVGALEPRAVLQVLHQLLRVFGMISTEPSFVIAAR